MEFQVEARNVTMRKAWQDKIEDEKEKLNRHHPGLVHHLRVTIAETASHKEGGFEVRVVATVPNDTVVVTRKGESVKPLLVEGFDTLGLQLKELQRKRRQTVTVPEGARNNAQNGVIKSIYLDQSYGFILSPEGREIYFHENALKDLELDELAEGDKIRFGEGEADKGPCAAWVRPA